MVVEADEDGEGDEGGAENDAVERWARPREGCEAHQAGRVDHRELVDQLHWVCRRISSLFRNR